jgi:hypothetical protein
MFPSRIQVEQQVFLRPTSLENEAFWVREVTLNSKIEDVCVVVEILLEGGVIIGCLDGSFLFFKLLFNDNCGVFFLEDLS